MFLIDGDFWEVKDTKEKGRGVFAKKEIKAGTIIGDYIGKVIKTAEYDFSRDKGGLYLMYLNDRASIYPDLTRPGMHLLNHSCEPNCFIKIYKGHTLFFAIRDIEPEEELTISYMLAPVEEQYTHVCKCGSKSCTGTMHLSKEKYDEWQEFQVQNKKKAGVVRFTFGKNLSRLNSYPRRINSNRYDQLSGS
ncbi:MAG: SET domain-containing protein-lysine N-methyltransferase [bacterium]|nr:SET domain-containing protein-lysine N-methyltransferase [bacterium]